MIKQLFNNIQKCLLAMTFLFAISEPLYAKGKKAEQSDRQFWCSLLYKMASPVLENMSKGQLRKNMLLEISPRWDGRTKEVAYMECFGRVMAGIAPWLSLPDDNTEEGKMRKQVKTWALASYKNAVDPESPDYLSWNRHGQTLVDAAYIAESFLRAPNLWKDLDSLTQQRYIKAFQGLRRFTPVYSNWLIFVSTIETFLATTGKNNYDAYRILMGCQKMNEWYVGDGWYSDGTHFAYDYYNSFVIQPMFVEVLQILQKNKLRIYGLNQNMLSKAEKRLTRHAAILERMISPEGALPVFGRSITYRLGCLQALSLAALQKRLPEEVSEAQVRCGLTAVMKRMFKDDRNFNSAGYLTLGYNGSQPGISDVYTNGGSLYMTTLAFLPLGLSADDSFWTSAPEKWTSKKAWDGDEFPKDHAFNE